MEGCGSTLSVGVKLRVQQALRSRGQSGLTRQRRDLLLSWSWAVEGKKALEECLWDSLCRVIQALVNSSGEQLNCGHGRLGPYFSPSTTYFIISSYQE